MWAKLVAFAAATLIASGAWAAQVLITASDSSNTLQFQIDQAPSPVITTGDYFGFSSFPVMVNGVASTGLIQFWTNPGSLNGGFTYSVDSGSFFDFTDGPQLFTGSTVSPTIILGTFDYGAGQRISVGAVGAAVPEPASWAMFIVGFGLIGQVRRRKAGYWRASAI